MATNHCGDDCTTFEWGEWPGVDGAVLLCATHGLLAPGSAYEVDEESS